jgi:hypothetical protein
MVLGLPTGEYPAGNRLTPEEYDRLTPLGKMVRGGNTDISPTSKGLTPEEYNNLSPMGKREYEKRFNPEGH